MNISEDRPPGCPARNRRGNGTGISAADFVLVVHDCEKARTDTPATTEAFGYFRLPGEEHDDDTLETASIVVPARSPIARMAHQVNADPDGTLTRHAETTPRSNVTRCPCTAMTQRPALNETRLLLALEHATGSGPRRS